MTKKDFAKKIIEILISEKLKTVNEQEINEMLEIAEKIVSEKSSYTKKLSAKSAERANKILDYLAENIGKSFTTVELFKVLELDTEFNALTIVNPIKVLIDSGYNIIQSEKVAEVINSKGLKQQRIYKAYGLNEQVEIIHLAPTE